jgi:DNA invertase Pin-like site-specific DNA recombinase
LFLGTRKDNSDDMRAKGRAKYYVGDNHNKAKLTEDQVLQIYEMAHDCIYTQDEIGEMFGVSRQTVSKIKYQRRWQHLWLRPEWTTPVIEEVKGKGQ